ncbi:MAG: nucleoside deaminase [Bacteroidales bacterium]|nr:nucleoside deaminase [Bacteroidales bacterium]
MSDFFTDEYFMKQALMQAKIAFEKNEVPVGAVIVYKDQIISRAHNLSETLNDATAHAEMQAITAASNMLGAKYLKDCTLYVTVEPCVMCAGASYWSQIGKIVYGTDDDKRGYSIFGKKIIHPRTEIIGGVLKQECAELISDFFYKIRQA